MRYAILLLLLAGCSEKPAANKFTPLSDVDPKLIEVAKQTLPNVTFDSARKIKVKGEDAFEIRGKMANGKIREVEVSSSGQVIEIE